MSRTDFAPRVRRAVLDASLGRCSYCGDGLDPDGYYAIDHVQPLALGGTDAVTNLVACCRSCNSRKSDQSLLHFLYRGSSLPVDPSPAPRPLDASGVEGLRTSKQVAAELGIHRTRVTRLATLHGIGHKVGPQAWIFTREDVAKLRAHSNGPGRPGRPPKKPPPATPA